MSRRGRVWSASAAVLIALVLSAVVLACGSDDPAAPLTSTTTPTTSTTTPDLDMTADDFVNLADMTPVAGFFVDNPLGDVADVVAVAESADGGRFPVGTVLQLVPGEAMVKRQEGWSPETNDWEFFELTVSAEGTEISTRGGVEVVNQFGGSCFSCHAAADPQWDLICGTDHGCEPLPLTRELIEAVQAADPRPRQADG